MNNGSPRGIDVGVGNIDVLKGTDIGVLRNKFARGFSCFMTFILFASQIALAILGFIYNQPPSLMYFLLLIILFIFVFGDDLGNL